VTTDPQSRRATTLTARANITDAPTKDILSSGAEVSSRQVSPCVMEVRIGQTRKSLVYPLPVIGSRSKLRIARKSFYVEVCCIYPRILTLSHKVRCRLSFRSQSRFNRMASPSIDSQSHSPTRSEPPGTFTICNWIASLSWTFPIDPAWIGLVRI
jgi:hypothetical protein